jgi:hypothetical protein
MRRLQSILLFVGLATLVGSPISPIGCGGGSESGGAVYLGSGSGTLYIYTELTTGVWPQAAVNGYVVPGSYSCNPSTDDNCTIGFGETEDGTNGELIFSTDTLPASWEFAAEADSNCAAGADYGPQTVSSGDTIQLYCGTISTGSLTASPDQCTDTLNENTGKETSNCPTNITLSSSTSIFPTTYALTVTNYGDEAGELSSGGDSASSSTSITVSTPNTHGTTVLTVVDPTTDQVLGATTFLRSYDIILPGK